MPLYEIKCSSCGDIDTIWRPIALRDNLPTCICEGVFTRIVSAPAVKTDITPYTSPVTGEWINSRAQQREDLKRHGKILYEPGLKQDIARNAVEVKEKAFEPLEKAIDETVKALVNTGKIDA